MSHLIEEYAKNLGVKADKTPIIFEHFWPLPFDRYVVINSGGEAASKIYKHFGIVLDMLVPVLAKNGINVIQIGSEKDPRLGNVSLRLIDLNPRQFAYIVSRSILYVGSDCVWSHYANSKNIPIVTIHGNAFAGISNGFWGGEQINIEGKWDICPSLSASDPHASVNKIKPEEIAHACCKLLNISYKNSLKTQFIGKLFGEAIVEIVPDFSPSIELHEEYSYFLRCDYTDNTFLPMWCNHLPKFSVFVNKDTDMNCLAHFQSKINALLFEVNSDDNDIRVAIDRASKICKNTVLITDEKNLGLVRNKWFDYKVLPKRSDETDKVKYNKNFWVASSKLVLDKNGRYSSLYHRKAKIIGVGKMAPMPDDKEFLEELEHFVVFEKIP